MFMLADVTPDPAQVGWAGRFRDASMTRESHLTKSFMMGVKKRYHLCNQLCTAKNLDRYVKSSRVQEFGLYVYEAARTWLVSILL